MKEITPHLYLIPSSGAEICSNIYIIAGKNYSFFVDVSNKPIILQEALALLNTLHLPPLKGVILTHFHEDHVANVSLLNSDIQIYETKNTSRYIKRLDSIVYEETLLDLGGCLIRLILVPSLHAKGCLDVLVDGVLLVGDSLGSHESKEGEIYFDPSIAYEMEKKVMSVDFTEAYFGHGENHLNKEQVGMILQRIKKEGAHYFASSNEY
jgi:glyoxylase-like metal-dependent hydrolase (beta-lactamase superfamily II)